MNEEYIKKLFEQTGLDESYYDSFKKDISSNPEYNKKVFKSIGLDDSYYNSFKKDTGLLTEPVKKKEESDLSNQEDIMASPSDGVQTISLSEEEVQAEQPATESTYRKKYFKSQVRNELMQEGFVFGSPEFNKELEKRANEKTEDSDSVSFAFEKGKKRAVQGIYESIPFIFDQIATATLDDDQLSKLNSLDLDSRREVIKKMTKKSYKNIPDFAKNFLSEWVFGEEGEDGVIDDIYFTAATLDDEIEKLERVSKQFDTSIGEDILNLDVGQASGRIVNAVTESTPSLLQAMVPYVGLASVGLSTASQKSRGLQEEGDELGLATSANSVLTGAVEAVTEKISAGLGKKFLKSFDINPDFAIETIKKTVGRFFKEGSLEGLSESASELSTSLIDNLVSGDEDAFVDIWSRIVDAGIIGGAMGGGLSASGSGVKRVRQHVQSKSLSRDIESSRYETMPDMFKRDNPIDKDNLKIAGKRYSRKFLERDLSIMVKKGEITKGEMDARMDTFDDIKSYYEMVDVDLSDDQKVEAAEKIRQRNELERQIQGKDPNLGTVKNKKDQIEKINDDLGKIVEPDAEFVEETETETETEAEAIQDPEGINKYLKELKETKESDLSTYWSVDTVKEEDTVDGKVIDTEDGAAFVGRDGDIKGVFKKLKSKAKGVAQEILKKAVESGGTKLDNFVTGAKGVKLQEIYEKAGFRVVSRTPFNEKFAPEGWNPDDGKPDVVAMIYDPNNELDIEVKTFEDPESGYDDMIDYRDEVLNRKEDDVDTELETETTDLNPEEGDRIDEADKDRVDSNIDGIFKKTTERNSGKMDKETITEMKIENAVNYLQKTKWYEQATDIQRESAVRDIHDKAGKKQPKNISVNKILGRKRKRITVDEVASLKDQIRLEARAERKAKLDIKSKRKNLSAYVSNILKKTGKIDNKKLNAIQKRINSVNVDNPVMVDRFLNYMENVMTKSNYREKLSEANNLRARAKKGNKSIDVNIHRAAKEYGKINPSMVGDIDAYIEIGKKIKEGLSQKGISLSEVNSYTEKALQSQRKKIEQEVVSKFEEENDIDGMTYDEVMEIIKSQKESGVVDTERLKIARARMIKNFDINRLLIKQILKTGKDPFTGQKINFNSKAKDLMGLFLNIDKNSLNLEFLSDVNFGIMNMISNGTYGGLETMLSTAMGARRMSNFKGKARPLRFFWSKSVGRVKGGYLTSINVMFESIFGVENSQKFLDTIGFSKMKQQANRSQNKSNFVINSYLDMFKKSKDFHSDKNIYSRGLLSVIYREALDSDLDPSTQFEYMKNMIKQSYESLLKSRDKREVKKGQKYQEVYDELLSDANSVEEVRSRMSEDNLKAVDFWVDAFKKDYDKYREVSESVYNKLLNQEENYTPRVFKKVAGVPKKSKDLIETFNLDNYLYKKESGNLMKAKISNSLPKTEINGQVTTTHYLDLNFDVNMANQFTSLNIDVDTAATVRQIQGALDTKDFNNAFSNDEDADLARKIITRYVNDKRQSSYVDEKELKALSKTLDRLSRLGASKALGGITQPIKQVLPVALNTFINSGRLDIGEYFNNAQAIQKILSESGQDVSNRDMGAISSLNKINTSISEGNAKVLNKIGQYVESVSDKWMTTFLSNPDVYIAKVSWVSYYKQMHKKKYGTAKIDWENHKVDQEIADYANTQVARNQNTSDNDMQGLFMKDNSFFPQLIRKTVMPFANFAINQKMRLHSDIINVTNKNMSTEERLFHLRSLGATAAEVIAFHGISLSISYGIFEAISSILGYDEPEEEREKRINNLIKGKATYIVSDYLSPIPVLDKPTLTLMNKGLRSLQSEEELSPLQKELGVKPEEPFVLFDGDSPGQSVLQDFGMYGILPEKIIDNYDIIKSSITGEYTSEFMGRETTGKYDPNSDTALLSLSFIQTLYNAGFLPSEAASVVRYGDKILKKKGKEYEKLIEKYK
jgi:hypothetical protein